jgi:alpha-tubulin suppressor-like RCC1 family protein
MKKFFVAALAACTLFVASCGGGAGSDPKATLIAFFEAMSKKDFTAAKKMATKDSETMINFIEKGTNTFGSKEKKDMDFDKSKVEFGDAKIEGDKATVTVKDKASGEGTNFTLKKEEGSWKVAFSKGGFMEMGMDKFQENGLDMDKLEEGLDKLKDINADSLNQIIKSSNEELKKINMDSLAEKMKAGGKDLEKALEELKKIKTN